MRITISLSCCALLSCLATSGCASGKGYVKEPPPDSLRSIYVVRRGWHTGVAIATRDWPNRHWSLLGEFPGADYLEFGWGDERFYQADRATVWKAIGAALWPTDSVVHVIGLREPIRDNVHATAFVEVPLPIDRLRALATAIEQEFAGDDPIPTGATLRAAPVPNRFYKAERRFFFPRMCNWWTAMWLREAGCPIAPATVIFAARIVREARECAASVAPGGPDGSDLRASLRR
ncbi:MAG: DUF2459 domain-containing protein [Steroidobacteraceae bacterium]